MHALVEKKHLQGAPRCRVTLLYGFYIHPDIFQNPYSQASAIYVRILAFILPYDMKEIQSACRRIPSKSLEYNRFLQIFGFYDNVRIRFFCSGLFRALRSQKLRICHDCILRQVKLPSLLKCCSPVLLLPVAHCYVKILIIGVGHFKRCRLFLPRSPA